MTEDRGVRIHPGRVAILELCRPPENYFDMDMVTALVEALEDLSTDGACRAAVLCSEGKHFCAGFRLIPGVRLPDPDENGADIYETAVRLWEQPLPVVAAVQGAAIGGGVGLALAADFRVTTPESRFAVNFATLGLHPGFGISATLPRVVGEQRALELLYTGKRITGTEAHAIGLCDRLVAPEALRSEAIEFAEEIAASAPLAVRDIRQTMRGDLPAAVRDALERARSVGPGLARSSDFAEGVKASMERRKPEFTGT